jgi:hypothetical protein
VRGQLVKLIGKHLVVQWFCSGLPMCFTSRVGNNLIRFILL